MKSMLTLLKLIFMLLSQLGQPENSHFSHTAGVVFVCHTTMQQHFIENSINITT